MFSRNCCVLEPEIKINCLIKCLTLFLIEGDFYMTNSLIKKIKGLKFYIVIVNFKEKGTAITIINEKNQELFNNCQYDL